MFVLKNAWAALGRVKWRTALIALLALLVSFSATVDLAVIRADDTANNETYQSQKATAVIRPTAQTKAKRDGAFQLYRQVLDVGKVQHVRNGRTEQQRDFRLYVGSVSAGA